MKKFQTSLYFDMRAPSFGTPAPKLYAAALDMASFADEIGVDRIGLMEHHASEDGYLPSPFVMGGGIAARTRNCRINLGAVILPLHDPVKIAEHIAVLDQISGGRAEVIFGAGYVASEFARFNVSLRDRGRLLDRGIEIIIRALRGERFDDDGREIFVRPLPIQAPEQILMVGGSVVASAKRAARFGLGFSPMRLELLEIYEAECRKLGHEPGRRYGPSIPLSIHLADDPDKAWHLLKKHSVHVARAYAAWTADEPYSSFESVVNEDAVRASEMFAIWTPEELIAKAASLQDHSTLGFMPLLGGVAPEIGWQSLELLKSVMPQLQAVNKAS
jgi:alkanesulfonate monooxygenase SsuD/methylene tetrahydromethanopterin reductase-like flavin-dependent oxidoreductase (luciferase family)